MPKIMGTITKTEINKKNNIISNIVANTFVQQEVYTTNTYLSQEKDVFQQSGVYWFCEQ